jgi:hypothetical protein
VFRRIETVIFTLGLGVFLVIYGGIHIGPAVSAAEGHGIHGYFVAQNESCDSGDDGDDSCSWSGEFKLPDGTVTRTNVTWVGSDSSMEQGTVVPALDTGDRSSVYQVGSIDQWVQPALFLLFGVFCFVGLILMLIRALRRRTAARRASG